MLLCLFLCLTIPILRKSSCAQTNEIFACHKRISISPSSMSLKRSRFLPMSFTYLCETFFYFIDNNKKPPTLQDFHFHNVTFYVCYPYPDEWGIDYRQSMVLTRFVVYFAAPLLVIAIFYALMAHHLIRSARDLPGEMHGAVRQVRKLT